MRVRRISPRRVSRLPGLIVLTPWSLDDHDLLHALNSDPAQMAHVGGAETDQKIADRNAKYAKDPGQLKITVDGEAAGWVGFWPREWNGAPIYEMGWNVLARLQGRGVATQATLLALDVLRSERRDDAPRVAHAFPNTDNGPSNAVCRKAGFTLQGEASFEYPPGTWETVNDWRIEL
jgi:RimJ/RimL family protein N-acetyltransferase